MLCNLFHLEISLRFSVSLTSFYSRLGVSSSASRPPPFPFLHHLAASYTSACPQPECVCAHLGSCLAGKVPEKWPWTKHPGVPGAGGDPPDPLRKEPGQSWKDIRALRSSKAGCEPQQVTEPLRAHHLHSRRQTSFPSPRRKWACWRGFGASRKTK